MRRIRYTAVAITFTLVVIGTLGGTAQAAFPGGDGRIAFTGGTHFLERARIYTSDADGSGRDAVTPENRYSFAPAWSADGLRIAFVRFGRTSAGVYGYGLLTANPNGAGLDVVIPIGSGISAIYSPSWAPDDSSIAFCGYRHGRRSIYTVDADGANLTKVTLGNHNDCDPAWSPDGNSIALDTYLSEQTSRIVTINPDGTGRAVVVGTRSNFNPDWSPDGSHLVFERLGFARSDVFTVRTDGTELTNLTRSPHRDETTPSYSPSGTWIAYARTQSRFTLNEDLWFRRADGTGWPHRVTDTPLLDEFQPSWQPI